jgi:hypothetical protein
MFSRREFIGTSGVLLARASLPAWADAFQPSPSGDAPWNVEAIGPAQRLAPYTVPALKLSSFTFTSVSDAI